MDFDFSDLEIEQLKGELQSRLQEFHDEYLQEHGLTEKEFRAQCEPYRQAGEALLPHFVQYAGQKETLWEEFSARVVHEERGNGGILHRGYYCPSRIQDIVMRGVTRGRICRKDGANFTHRYGFDADGRLILVQNGTDVEFIFDSGECSVGILFSDSTVVQVTECRYDSKHRIVQYTTVLPSPFGDELLEYECEEYAYGTDEMSVKWVRLTIDECWMLLEDRYTFHAENGYWKEYTVEMLKGSDLSGEPVEERTHPVKRKRNVE